MNKQYLSLLTQHILPYSNNVYKTVPIEVGGTLYNGECAMRMNTQINSVNSRTLNGVCGLGMKTRIIGS